MVRQLNAVLVLMTTSSSPFSTAAIYVATGAWQTFSKELSRMRKMMMCALLSAAVACCGSALYAQDNMSQGSGQMSQGGGQGMGRMQATPDQRLQHMTKMLSLTPDQQQKIKPILEQEQQQMMAAKQDTTMSQADRKAKMMQIHQGTNDQIKAVLTPDQQTKWEQQMQSHKGGMGHDNMGQGSMGQGTPAPQ
jgi:periplasmic protein CpxP/Spy